MAIENIEATTELLRNAVDNWELFPVKTTDGPIIGHVRSNPVVAFFVLKMTEIDVGVGRLVRSIDEEMLAGPLRRLAFGMKREDEPSFNGILMSHLTVSDVARRLGVRPRDISDLFYRRALDESQGPIVGGRRMVAVEDLPEIRRALIRPGKFRDIAEAATAS